MYGEVDNELCISDIEDDIPMYPKIMEIIKTSRELIPGLIFHIEGEYSDEYNVGVWVPEDSTSELIFQVHAYPKKEEKGN